MAKEIDQTFYVGHPNAVDYFDGVGIQFLIDNRDNRRTANYYIIPDDALLDGV